MQLDEQLKTQVREVFSDLDKDVFLELFSSSHEKQVELNEFLAEIASLSSLIHIRNIQDHKKIPQFFVSANEQMRKISFVGIPGGHEFSSLVLAILQLSGKGKWPDEGIAKRIRNLQGPIRLRTYISLSCENCPNVVQTLNQMSLIHPDFEHQMIDGEFHQEEIDQLGIQGVPAVMDEVNLVHSGKTSLAELLAKLEKHFGTNKKEITQSVKSFDVVVIGGGPAGVSSAIYSARKGQKTALVADRLGGQLQDTKGIENFISIPYTEGPKLSEHLAKHLEQYQIEVLEHRRVSKVEPGQINTITLDSNEIIKSKSLIVATGAKWRELNVPGEKEYLGRGVAFCPHCDGPYYKGKNVAVVGGGNSGVEAAIDLSNIVKSVVLIEFASDLKADEVLVKKLTSLSNVQIVTNAKTTKVMGDGEKVTALSFEDRTSGEETEIKLDGVFVQIGLVPNSAFLEGIVERTSWGEIVIDEKCRTSQPGIYAAGDVTTVPYKQIVVSLGEGAKAALSCFEYQMAQ